MKAVTMGPMLSPLSLQAHLYQQAFIPLPEAQDTPRLWEHINSEAKAPVPRADQLHGMKLPAEQALNRCGTVKADAAGGEQSTE